MTFDAFWLPGLPPDRVMQSRELDGLTIRFPVLQPDQVRDICTRLQGAAEQARALTVQQRIRAIAQATAFLRDPDCAAFHEACQLVSLTTRYSLPMTRFVLQRMAQDWTEPALQHLIQAELPDGNALDQVIVDPASQRRVMAIGPRLNAQVFAGNVPGVAVTALIRTLLVKAPSFAKTALEEPILTVLFARSLHQQHPELARTLALTYWPGGSTALEATLFAQADVATVYGGQTLVEQAQKLRAADQRLIVHGPRLSLGIVHSSALQPARLAQAADQIALAVATFDQQGCVSPHAVFLIGDFEAARSLARALADALGRIEAELPRGPISTAEALAIHDARARLEFRHPDRHPVLFSGQNTEYTVLLDDSEGLEPSCLNRLVYVKPVPSLDHLIESLTPLSRYLQSIAMHGFPEAELPEISARLGRAGASRITSFAELPWPPPDWHHDGGQPLRELIRWLDIEI